MAGRLYPILIAFVICGFWTLVSASVVLMGMSALSFGR
jgi:hypothetical protein